MLASHDAMYAHGKRPRNGVHALKGLTGLWIALNTDTCKLETDHTLLPAGAMYSTRKPYRAGEAHRLFLPTRILTNTTRKPSISSTYDLNSNLIDQPGSHPQTNSRPE
ncbi:hypothetical protein PtA15_4A130 [Puccinia triticina]|uniref:Uncharacterized protein n=1 Tax=Puccinia triticina TaxID=208348 RepID=A0ABY7CLM2_9BASI|nr:uncharacterized protein PtA15_4A130 [Puccinia triticina]WAQ83682.1 hypothetical protein PtA15_4A130 [Puccinia triticina]